MPEVVCTTDSLASGVAVVVASLFGGVPGEDQAVGIMVLAVPRWCLEVWFGGSGRSNVPWCGVKVIFG